MQGVLLDDSGFLEGSAERVLQEPLEIEMTRGEPLEEVQTHYSSYLLSTVGVSKRM